MLLSKSVKTAKFLRMKSGIGARPFGYRNLYYDVSSDEQMVKSGIQIASRVQAENRLK